MKSNLIKELRGLCEKLLDGEWYYEAEDDGYYIYTDNPGDNYEIASAICRAEDAKFIAAARTALPELLDIERYHVNKIKQLEGEIERLKNALEIIAGHRQCVDNLMGNVDVALATYRQIRRVKG